MLASRNIKHHLCPQFHHAVLTLSPFGCPLKAQGSMYQLIRHISQHEVSDDTLPPHTACPLLSSAGTALKLQPHSYPSPSVHFAGLAFVQNSGTVRHQTNRLRDQSPHCHCPANQGEKEAVTFPVQTVATEFHMALVNKHVTGEEEQCHQLRQAGPLHHLPTSLLVTVLTKG